MKKILVLRRLTLCIFAVIAVTSCSDNNKGDPNTGPPSLSAAGSVANPNTVFLKFSKAISNTDLDVTKVRINGTALTNEAIAVSSFDDSIVEIASPQTGPITVTLKKGAVRDTTGRPNKADASGVNIQIDSSGPTYDSVSAVVSPIPGKITLVFNENIRQKGDVALIPSDFIVTSDTNDDPAASVTIDNAAFAFNKNTIAITLGAGDTALSGNFADHSIKVEIQTSGLEKIQDAPSNAMSSGVAISKIGNVVYSSTHTYHANDKSELTTIIDAEILKQGDTADLNMIDTSSITDMSALFISDGGEKYKNFNGNISEWDTSNVTSMANMFMSASAFNQDLSGWDVSKVTNMSAMFWEAAAFNQDLSGWDVSKVTIMSGMFVGAVAFNQSLSEWDVSQVTNMYAMFSGATAFNGDLSGWDVSNVTSMRQTFHGATIFNQDLSGWDVSNVTDISWMFSGATAFNQDISGWDVSQVTSMRQMFYGATAFNQPMSGWNVSKVTNMSGMFWDAIAFDQDISGWDVSQVTNMSYMFYGATTFNQNISGWEVSQVTDMSWMLSRATAFDQPINTNENSWDTSNVTNMQGMFWEAAAFNQDISGWNVSNVTNMTNMFNGATTFNQDLKEWNVSSLADKADMFNGSGLTGNEPTWY